MFLDSLPCLCLDLHAFVLLVRLCLDLHAFRLLAMFLFRFIYLCIICHVYAQIYMLVPRSMSLCLGLCVYVLCAMLVCSNLCWLLCHVLLQPFLSLDIPLSCVLSLPIGCRSRSYGPSLHPYTQAYIKGFGSFPLCMSMFVCLLLCFISILASLDLGFALLCALHGLVLMWSHLSPLELVLLLPFVRYIFVVLVCLIYTFLFRAMLIYLPCLLCATLLAFFASLHLCMLAYMFMHESVCRPYNNPMELWTLNPNLH